MEQSCSNSGPLTAQRVHTPDERVCTWLRRWTTSRALELKKRKKRALFKRYGVIKRLTANSFESKPLLPPVTRCILLVVWRYRVALRQQRAAIPRKCRLSPGRMTKIDSDWFQRWPFNWEITAKKSRLRNNNNNDNWRRDHEDVGDRRHLAIASFDPICM